MPNIFLKEKSFSTVVVIFIAIAFGWIAYRFVKSDLLVLHNTAPPPPDIVFRTNWSARPLTLEAVEEFGAFDAQTNPAGVLIYKDNLRSVLNTIVVHHSAFPNAGPKEIQDLHMDRRGFADVAYHFMIATDGTIYEGREINIRGAHVLGYNTGSVGIVLMGNFNDEQPTASQIGSLRTLVDYLRYTYDIRYLAGHRDYPDQSPDGTECPGDNLYPLLSAMVRELGMKYGIGGYEIPDWVK